MHGGSRCCHRAPQLSVTPEPIIMAPKSFGIAPTLKFQDVPGQVAPQLFHRQPRRRQVQLAEVVAHAVAPCSGVTLCRSKWGHCGSSPQHCNDESTWRVDGCGPLSTTVALSSSTRPTLVTTTTTTTQVSATATTTVSKFSGNECVSHATLKCINDASSFWPKCDPSQSKKDNFPTSNGRTRNDYGHFCTKPWADALNAVLSHPVVNKCGDKDAQIKLLAQVAVETGYFSTLFQPADGGAGLVHMIPANWPTNAQDMEDLFGGSFLQQQAAMGSVFFQKPNEGWSSVAAWFKQTNRVIPGCGKNLFEESFSTQTRCIFGRGNDRT